MTPESKPPYLTDAEVLDLVDLASMTDDLVQAYEDLGSGQATSTLRVRAHLGDLDSSAMSAYWARHEVGGGKMYVNSPRGRGFLIPLFRGTGELLISMSGEVLTAARTAATTGVGVRLLAPDQKRVAAMFGTGAQARWQARVLAQELDLDDLRVVGRTPERAGPVVADLVNEGIPARVTTAHEAVVGSDVVVTVTASETPILDGSWLEPHALVVAVGSTKHYRQEIDLETVRRSSFVVSDSSEGARIEAGDLIHAAQLDGWDWEQLVGLEEVAAGAVEKPEAGGITLFESQGLALQDVVGAWSVYQRFQQGG